MMFMLGTGTGTSSSDGQSSSVAASGNLSRHEARVRAAASAASIYGRSFVYPSSENTLVWYGAMSFYVIYITLAFLLLSSTRETTNTKIGHMKVSRLFVASSGRERISEEMSRVPD